MDKWLVLVVLVCFLFVITYEPSGKKKGGKESYQPVQKIETCCDDVEYMAENKDQCQAAHFRGVQFIEKNGCPRKVPCTSMGAVISC